MVEPMNRAPGGPRKRLASRADPARQPIQSLARARVSIERQSLVPTPPWKAGFVFSPACLKRFASRAGCWVNLEPTAGRPPGVPPKRDRASGAFRRPGRRHRCVGPADGLERRFASVHACDPSASRRRRSSPSTGSLREPAVYCEPRCGDVLARRSRRESGHRPDNRSTGTQPRSREKRARGSAHG
jgi:hypothetical protein